MKMISFTDSKQLSPVVRSVENNPGKSILAALESQSTRVCLKRSRRLPPLLADATSKVCNYHTENYEYCENYEYYDSS